MVSRLLTNLCMIATLLSGVCAESDFKVGFQLRLNPSTVEWKEDLTVNATCNATCDGNCDECYSLNFNITSRNKTYSPGGTYTDVLFHPVKNITADYTRKCEIEQTITLKKLYKNDSGSIICTSAKASHRSGLAYLIIIVDVKSTDATLPTTLVNKTVTDEVTGKKLVIAQRSFDATAATPTVNCSNQASGINIQFSWTWLNGSQLSYNNDGLESVRWPATGTLDGNTTFSSLKLNNFATKARNYVGQYKCSIGVDQFRTPNVKSAPVVKLSEKDYRSVMEGDVLTQACTIVAHPLPTINWKKNGDPLALEPGRVELSADNRTLTISALQKEDAGVFVCSVQNDLGLGEAYIRLRVKDRLAALWPFLGIVAEVIILVTIILLYEKKRAAQKRNQGNQDTAEVKDDRNANDGDVRQRPVKA